MYNLVNKKNLHLTSKWVLTLSLRITGIFKKT